MNLVCAHCGTTNRLPPERLAEQPVCGRCKAELLEAAPFALTDASLPAYLAGTELPVLVDFWAAWCGPCKAMAPHFAQAARQRPQLRCAKVDTDASPQAAARYAIRSIPTLILFDRGREVARHSGAMSSADLLRWVQQQGVAMA